MNGAVEVYLWGTKIGAIAYEPGQTEVSTFEYDKDFIKMGIEVSPISVPIKYSIHTFDDISKKTFHGLAGFIADSLPDKFGNQLIDQYFALKGRSSSDITPLDRLLYIGNRAMGALEFKPAINLDDKNKNIELNLQDLSQLAEMILIKKEKFANELKNSDKKNVINLLRIGSSAGGARSKALVAMDKDGKLYDGTINHKKACKYYLLKFDSSSNSDRDNKDPKGMTKVEYIYSILARKCNINMPYTTFIQIEDDFHFLIERFDRIDKNKGFTKDKLHYVSWCGMAHAHRDETGAFSYEQLVMIVRELKLGQDSVFEIFKRAVFNLVGRNQDDHTKNFGFLMDRNGRWSLSPAFDITYSYDPEGKWTKSHQITLNGKEDNFTLEDIISFGKYCNLSKKKSLEVLNNTVSAFKEFPKLADRYKVDRRLKESIYSNLRILN